MPNNIAASVQVNAKLIADAMGVYQSTLNEKIRSDLVASAEMLLERLSEDLRFLIRKRISNLTIGVEE